MASTVGASREKAQYTGELTKGAARRVQSERVDFEKNPMYVDGIFFQYGDQLHAVKALVIGPPETPYQYGFYFFDIKYPNTYPWDPPQVTFMTSDRRVRLNPNLYVGGKVCLSILGTWSGPPWTPSCTLRAVMLSIQSLLHSHPLQNEPAFAKVTGERDERYSRILSYENIVVAVLRMLEYTPDGFSVFRPHMGYYFLRSLSAYKAVLCSFLSRQGEEEESPLGAFKTTYDPGACARQVEDWARRLRGDSALMRRVSQLEAEMRVTVPDLPSVQGGCPEAPAEPAVPSAPAPAPESEVPEPTEPSVPAAPPEPPAPGPPGSPDLGGAAGKAASEAAPKSISVEPGEVVISTSEAPETVTSNGTSPMGLRGLCKCFTTTRGRGDN